MTTRFTSTALSPRERGEEFGETFRHQIAETFEGYRGLFDRALAPGQRLDLEALGRRWLSEVELWAPDLAQEIAGLAVGAGVSPASIAVINARTEILALLRVPGRGECSTVVALRAEGEEPLALQNWDWYASMREGWLIWDIPHADGRRTSTLTEFGMLGKLGVNDRGVGVLFNILHHREDGGRPGVPVHVIARRVLDVAHDVAGALKVIGSARVSASTSMTVIGGLRAGKSAVAVELWPGGPGQVLPGPDGLLLHTNHFFSAPAALGDTEPSAEPDTLVRYDVLHRRLAHRGAGLTVDQARAALCDHTGGAGAVCCHPDPAEEVDRQFETLACVQLDFAAGRVDVVAGPPCGG